MTHGQFLGPAAETDAGPATVDDRDPEADQLAIPASVEQSLVDESLAGQADPAAWADEAQLPPTRGWGAEYAELEDDAGAGYAERESAYGSDEPYAPQTVDGDYNDYDHGQAPPLLPGQPVDAFQASSDAALAGERRNPYRRSDGGSTIGRSRRADGRLPTVGPTGERNRTSRAGGTGNRVRRCAAAFAIG